MFSRLSDPLAVLPRIEAVASLCYSELGTLARYGVPARYGKVGLDEPQHSSCTTAPKGVLKPGKEGGSIVEGEKEKGWEAHLWLLGGLLVISRWCDE